MATVDTLLVRIEADMSQLKRQLNATKVATSKTAGQMSQGFQGVRTATANLTNQFSILKTAIAGVGFAFLGASVVRANAEMEDLKRTLTSVFGTAERGDSAFKFINIFAQRTPFDIQTLTRAFIQLKGAGVEPTQKLLTTLGNAASVTTDKIGAFESLVRITTRSVGGGLGLEELEQLVSKGIPVFQILEDELNITRMQVSDFGRTAKGAAEIMQALNRSFDTRFPTAMADSSQNLSVQLSNLGIAINNAFLAIGESGLNKEIKNTVTALTDATTSGKSFLTIIGGALAKALRFLRNNFDNLIITISGLVAIKAARWGLTTSIAMVKLAIAIAKVTRMSAVFGVISRAVFSKKGIAGILLLGTVLASMKDKLEDAFEGLSKFFSGLTKKLDETFKDVKEFFGFVDDVDLKDLNEDLEKLEKNFTSGGKGVRTALKDFKGLDAELKRLAPSTEEVSKKIKDFELLLASLESQGIGRNTERIEQLRAVIQILKSELEQLDPVFSATLSAVTNLGNGISDSLAEAFMKGKFSMESFKDLFRQFVQEMISQAIRLMVINKIINSAFNLRGTPSALPEASFGKAGGGRIQAKRPTLVGERGPELFIPSTSGVVKNNMDTRSMIGSGQVTNIYQNFNVSAGVSQTVRAEVLGLMPLIKEQTLNAVVERKQRGGAFATALS